MKCKILSLFFLVGNLTAFGSDSDSVGSDSDETNSILRKQVYSLRSDADFETDFLNEFKFFPATIFSPAVQAKIIEKVPSLEAARGKSGEEFKGELIQSAVLNAISSAAVFLDGFEEGSYRETRDRQRYKLTRPGYTGPLVRIWYDSETGAYYNPDDFIEDVDGHVYYNKTKIIEQMHQSVELVEAAIDTKPSLCTGKSRSVLNSCTKPHPFHLGCIKNALDRAGQKCPSCTLPTSKKEIKFEPACQEGESCGVCFEKFEPAVTAAAVFGRSGAGDGSSAGAGGSSTASRVSPVRSRAGARKTTDYYGGDRSSGRDADKRHRRYGSGDHEDDTEPLA